MLATSAARDVRYVISVFLCCARLLIAAIYGEMTCAEEKQLHSRDSNVMGASRLCRGFRRLFIFSNVYFLRICEDHSHIGIEM